MNGIIDLSINLGNLLTIGSFLAGGVVFLMTMKSMISIVGVRLDALDKSVDLRLQGLERSNDNQNIEIKKLGDILVTLGRYEERFLRIEGMIDEFRHGRGLIKP